MDSIYEKAMKNVDDATAKFAEVAKKEIVPRAIGRAVLSLLEQEKPLTPEGIMAEIKDDNPIIREAAIDLITPYL